MTESALREIERDLIFASKTSRSHFYILKATVIELVKEIRQLQNKLPDPTSAEAYLAQVNQKLEIIMKYIDQNN